jgi:opacity protein-like surface antigen
VKKSVLFFLMLILFSPLSLFANESLHTKEHGSKYYVIAKGLMVLGAKKEGEEGDVGYGAGIDIGYHLPHDFAVEFVSSMAKNKVEQESVNYFTYGLALEYERHISKHFAAFVKGGVEVETENTEHTTESETGFIYAAGLEYIISPKYDIVLEYEGSTIESTMGECIFAGVKYNF